MKKAFEFEPVHMATAVLSRGARWWKLRAMLACSGLVDCCARKKDCLNRTRDRRVRNETEATRSLNDHPKKQERLGFVLMPIIIIVTAQK